MGQPLTAEQDAKWRARGAWVGEWAARLFVVWLGTKVYEDSALFWTVAVLWFIVRLRGIQDAITAGQNR